VLSAVLVAGAASVAAPLSWRPLVRIGEISYGLYLCGRSHIRAGSRFGALDRTPISATAIEIGNSGLRAVSRTILMPRHPNGGEVLFCPEADGAT
jgi:hypothetical protein